jgi:carboxypeptidase C (cathepsin A)
MLGPLNAAGRSRRVAAWCLLVCAAAMGASAEDAPAPNLEVPKAPIETRHRGIFNGQRVDYRAVVEPIGVTDAAGRPGASVVCIAYLGYGKRVPADRPVLFAFNGGPISPSDVLHMGMLGPKRVEIPDDVGASAATFKVVDNTYTLLDVADIVFIDPAGTGFSRVADGVDPKSYFSVDADAQQVTQFIVEWSKLHHRQASAKYLLGESYGTLRAAAVANQLQKLAPPMPLQGVILAGQALNIIEFSQRPANIISYVVSLPTLAAIGWSHGKVEAHGKTFDQFENEVAAFARGDYLTALFQGTKLSEDSRETIARRLEEYTGIPTAYYLQNDLQITKERYRRELLKDQGMALGMIDGRYKASNPLPPQAADPAGVIPEAYEKAFKSYLHDELKVDDTRAYLTKSPVDGLEGWDWDGSGLGAGKTPFSDWPYPRLLSEVFASNPQFRVMIFNGYQDTQTTVGAAQYLVDRSGWPSDRVSVHYYQGGHTTYSVEDSLHRMTDDVRALISDPSRSRGGDRMRQTNTPSR